MDTTKICIDCNRAFVITPKERAQMVANNLVHEPKRCIECRMVRRARSEGRPIYPFTCAQCKRPSHIDMKPIPAKPMLCAECFLRKKLNSIA